MPFRRALISSARVAMLSSVSSIAFSRSLSLMSSTFFSSSAVSSSFSQYAFFSSSADCSLMSSATISSIILITFSKLEAPPRRARATRRRLLPGAASSSCSAAARAFLALTCVWRSAGLGSVFLKSSNASSSFKILMVSASARSSSVRVLERSCHSPSFVSQPFLSSMRNFWSSLRVAFVSSRSSFSATISTPSCPDFSSFDSMDAVRVLISFSLARLRASKSLMACSSVPVASASSLLMVSEISFRIPTIWPLLGE
mmetsp:Transcript_106418/g.280722  ORF Transcript_106418/g.280722 Transcript_106418/m.280722 type:complete len:257 (-) Transcript_106418:666-1436(-)